MYGEKAVELLKELTRNKLDPIPLYNQELVKLIVDEVNHLHTQNEVEKTALGENGDVSQQLEYVPIAVRKTAQEWNQRCLLCYHISRLERIKKLRWELGGVLPAEIKNNLSPNEVEWFANYSKNLSSFMSSLNDGKGLDLTLHKKPPKRLYIQVRCLIDYGDYDLDDGTVIILRKDSIHYLPISQCEKLIHQGVMEQVKL